MSNLAGSFMIDYFVSSLVVGVSLDQTENLKLISSNLVFGVFLYNNCRACSLLVLEAVSIFFLRLCASVGYLFHPHPFSFTQFSTLAGFVIDGNSY